MSISGGLAGGGAQVPSAGACPPGHPLWAPFLPFPASFPHSSILIPSTQPACPQNPSQARVPPANGAHTRALMLPHPPGPAIRYNWTFSTCKFHTAPTCPSCSFLVCGRHLVGAVGVSFLNRRQEEGGLRGEAPFPK